MVNHKLVWWKKEEEDSAVAFGEILVDKKQLTQKWYVANDCETTTPADHGKH
jgi:hypothetical protein